MIDKTIRDEFHAIVKNYYKEHRNKLSVTDLNELLQAEFECFSEFEDKHEIDKINNNIPPKEVSNLRDFIDKLVIKFINNDDTIKDTLKKKQCEIFDKWGNTMIPDIRIYYSLDGLVFNNKSEISEAGVDSCLSFNVARNTVFESI